jgi:hypothetical protein
MLSVVGLPSTDPPRTRRSVARERRNGVLETHVLELAGAAGIELEFSTTRRARALRPSPSRGRCARIVVSPVRGQVSYLVALHELGHLLSRGNRSMRQLEREADAWRWALDRSLVELTPATARSLQRSLESYLLRARRRARLGHPTRATIPDRSSFFWQVLAELRTRALDTGPARRESVVTSSRDGGGGSR